MIRNAIFVSFALIAIVMQPVVHVEALGGLTWMLLLADELIAHVGALPELLQGLFSEDL